MTMRFFTARLGLMVGLLCAASAPLFAQEKTEKEPAKPAVKAETPAYSITTLKGGTRLIVLREPESPIVVTDVFFNVNRLDEGKWSGINALVARTWGVESEWRSAALTRRDVNRIGSAGTDVADDWVEIWAVSGPETAQVAESLRTLLTNQVANPHFSIETLKDARDDQQQARELTDDAVVPDALDALRERVWGTTPRAGNLLGSASSLQSLTPDEMTRYYRERFRPDRCVICISGNVDPDEIAKKVINSLGAGEWLSGPPAPALRRPAAEPIPTGLRDRNIGRTAPALVTMLGYTAPGTASGSASDYATLLLLDSTLTGGKSSRLFATLRDEPTGEAVAPLGYDIRSVVQAGQTQSLWAIYSVGTVPINESRARLRAALQAVVTDAPLTDDEVNRARALLKVNHARERQRARDRTTGLAWAEVMGLGAKFDIDFDTTLDAVTTDDVNRLAKRILSSPSALVYSSLAEPATLPAPPVTNTAAP